MRPRSSKLCLRDTTELQPFAFRPPARSSIMSFTKLRCSLKTLRIYLAPVSASARDACLGLPQLFDAQHDAEE